MVSSEGVESAQVQDVESVHVQGVESAPVSRHRCRV